MIPWNIGQVPIALASAEGREAIILGLLSSEAQIPFSSLELSCLLAFVY